MKQRTTARLILFAAVVVAVCETARITTEYERKARYIKQWLESADAESKYLTERYDDGTDVYSFEVYSSRFSGNGVLSR